MSKWCGRVGLPLALLLVAVSFSGCAFYQYRIWPNYDAGADTTVCGKSRPASRPSYVDVDLAATVDVARDLECQYESASRQHERTGPILATILTPLAAAIAGLAITGTTGAPIVALSLAGGSAFAYSGVVWSPQRERIYAEGKVAARCLLNVYVPFLLTADESKGLEDSVNSGPRDLLVLGQRLTDAAKEVRTAYGAMTIPSDLAQILADAEKLGGRLATLHAKVLELDAVLPSLATTLRGELTQIASEVNRALSKTELDISALKNSLISSFSAFTQPFSGAASATGDLLGKLGKAEQDAYAAKARLAPPGVLGGPDTKVDAVGKLLTAISDARQATVPVVKVLGRIADSPKYEGQKCVDVALANVKIEPLKLDGDTNPTVAPGSSTTLNITGGVRPYSVGLSGDASKALDEKLDESSTAYARLTISAKPGADTGSYGVMVTDHVKSSTLSVIVKVEPPKIEVAGPDRPVKPGDTVKLRVKGGKAPYTIAVKDDSKVFGDVASDTSDGVTTLNLPVRTDAKDGTYEITVSDANKLAAHFIKVEVKK